MLPSAGWPKGGIVEVVVPDWGIGELRLVLPAMTAMCRERRYGVWIAPPYTPYAPALIGAGLDLDRVLVLTIPPGSNHDLLWSAERMLRAAACGVVLAWPGSLDDRSVRRLQLAAQSSGNLGFVLRTVDHPYNWSAATAALRLRLRPVPEGLQVQVRKARGGCRRPVVLVSL